MDEQKSSQMKVLPCLSVKEEVHQAEGVINATDASRSLLAAIKLIEWAQNVEKSCSKTGSKLAQKWQTSLQKFKTVLVDN